MFQSSWTSWSSKIIALETVDSSQRSAGSLQLSRYSDVYSSKSATSSGGGPSGPRRVGDQLLGLGRDLVGVDLVAEQQQRVGPVRDRLVAHALDEREEGVDLAAARVLVLAEDVGLGVRDRHAARAERQPQRLVVRVGADDAWRIGVVRRRPARLAVEPDLVGQRAPGGRSSSTTRA